MSISNLTDFVSSNFSSLKLKYEFSGDASDKKDHLKRVFREEPTAHVLLQDFVQTSLDNKYFRKQQDSDQLKNVSPTKIATLDEVTAFSLDLVLPKPNKVAASKQTISSLFYKCPSCSVERASFIARIKNEKIFSPVNVDELKQPSFLSHPFFNEADDNQPERVTYHQTRQLWFLYCRWAAKVKLVHELFHSLQKQTYDANKKGHQHVKDSSMKRRYISDTKVSIPLFFKTLGGKEIYKRNSRFWASPCASEWQQIAMEDAKAQDDYKQEKINVDRVQGLLPVSSPAPAPTISWAEVEKSLFEFAPQIGDSTDGDSTTDPESFAIPREYNSSYAASSRNLSLDSNDPLSSSSMIATTVASSPSSSSSMHSSSATPKSSRRLAQSSGTMDFSFMSAAKNIVPEVDVDPVVVYAPIIAIDDIVVSASSSSMEEAAAAAAAEAKVLESLKALEIANAEFAKELDAAKIDVTKAKEEAAKALEAAKAEAAKALEVTKALEAAKKEALEAAAAKVQELEEALDAAAAAKVKELEAAKKEAADTLEFVKTKYTTTLLDVEKTSAILESERAFAVSEVAKTAAALAVATKALESMSQLASTVDSDLEAKYAALSLENKALAKKCDDYASLTLDYVKDRSSTATAEVAAEVESAATWSISQIRTKGSHSSALLSGLQRAIVVRPRQSK